MVLYDFAMHMQEKFTRFEKEWAVNRKRPQILAWPSRPPMNLLNALDI